MEDAMGFFSDIKDKIFNRHDQAVTTTASNTTAPAGTTAQPGATTAPAAPQRSGSPAPVQPKSSTTTANDVDVASILDQAASENGQELNWRKSIVDLMKALGIDSSLASRKELAAELGYTGDTSDSASMNIWLHKQVLQKLAENGGKVPADMLD